MYSDYTDAQVEERHESSSLHAAKQRKALQSSKKHDRARTPNEFTALEKPLSSTANRPDLPPGEAAESWIPVANARGKQRQKGTLVKLEEEDNVSIEQVESSDKLWVPYSSSGMAMTTLGTSSPARLSVALRRSPST